MADGVWETMRLPPDGEELLHELFHENSKTSHYDPALPEGEVVARMQAMPASLSFDSYPEIELPDSLTPLRLPLEEALFTRVTARTMIPRSLALEDLATLLHCGYGVTRDNAGTAWPRPFRTVPSGGALYPLEIFVHSASYVEGLQAGLYHYSPAKHNLRLLVGGDQTSSIADGLVQKNLAYDSSVLFFITALFERATFKYGDRGYRFVLLEAGHVAQNINLASGGLRLGCTNIGGFFDRQIDDLLGLDGVTHSTVYLVAVGEKAGEPEDTDADLVSVGDIEEIAKETGHGNG
jgi:SagB-type dehydrogenase family enzyme